MKNGVVSLLTTLAGFIFIALFIVMMRPSMAFAARYIGTELTAPGLATTSHGIIRIQDGASTALLVNDTIINIMTLPQKNGTVKIQADLFEKNGTPKFKKYSDFSLVLRPKVSMMVTQRKPGHESFQLKLTLEK